MPISATYHDGRQIAVTTSNLNGEPHFFLTTAAESTTIMEPRGCWVDNRRWQLNGSDRVAVTIDPPVTLDGIYSKRLILAARYQGESVLQIKSWPMRVNVSRTSAQFGPGDSDFEEFEFWAVAEIYPDSASAAALVAHVSGRARRERWPEYDFLEFASRVHAIDGSSRDELAAAISDLLIARPTIHAAYVVSVHSAGRSPEMVLCIHSAMGYEHALVRRIRRRIHQGAGFLTTSLNEIRRFLRRVYRPAGQLPSIIFIDSTQEAQLRVFCEPFYLRTG